MHLSYQKKNINNSVSFPSQKLVQWHDVYAQSPINGLSDLYEHPETQGVKNDYSIGKICVEIKFLFEASDNNKDDLMQNTIQTQQNQ